jgi:hypothetical protein
MGPQIFLRTEKLTPEGCQLSDFTGVSMVGALGLEPRIKSQLLYQLSYAPIEMASG